MDKHAATWQPRGKPRRMSGSATATTNSSCTGRAAMANFPLQYQAGRSAKTAAAMEDV